MAASPTRALGSRVATTLAASLALLVGAIAAPAADPPLPDGASVFAPPALETTPKAGVISEALKSAQPGDYVTLAGDFPATVEAFEVFGQTTDGDARRISVKPLRLSAETAVFALPDTLPRNSMYLIWPKSARAFGPPVAINRTEAWWIGPRKVSVGERFSIFGRNLTLGDGKASVFIASGPGAGGWLRVVDANPYRVDLEAPDMPAGAYDLRVHNGGGGPLGWSAPLRIELHGKEPPRETKTFDVRSYGARGDGAHDDGPAISAALAAAAASPPSRLYFPPGVYAADRGFSAKTGVIWRGAGRRESVLRFRTPLDRLAKTAFIYASRSVSDVTFEQMSIEADGKFGGPDRALIAIDGSRIRFRDMRLSSWGGATLKLSANDVAIDGGEITGAGSFFGSSSQLFVAGVTFRMTNDGESAIASWGGRDIAVTDNLLVNADPTRPDGNGIGRLFVAQPHFGSSRNLYFSGNETRDSAPRDCGAVDCNKGEQIILEFGGVSLAGRPAAIGPSSIAFRGLKTPETPGGAEVVVAAGRGLGQRRRIISAAGGTLTLDRPWDIMPDVNSSRFYVTQIAERVVVRENRFQGRTTHSEHDSNSTAVLVWGLCFDVVVADNDISRMRHGVMVAATSGTPEASVSAPFFTIVENNRISDGNNGIYTGLTFGYDTDPVISGGVGNVFRGNDIRSMGNIGIAFDTWDTTGGAFRATVFERNRIRDVRYGVVSGLKLIWSRDGFKPTPTRGTRLMQTVMHANEIDGGGRREAIAFRTDPFQDWTDVDGVWRGFPAGDRPQGADRKR